MLIIEKDHLSGKEIQVVVGNGLGVLVEGVGICQSIMKKDMIQQYIEVVRSKVETGHGGKIPTVGMAVRVAEIGTVAIVEIGTPLQAIHASRERMNKVRGLMDSKSNGVVVHMRDWMVSGNIVTDLQDVSTTTTTTSMTDVSKEVVAISGKDDTGEMTNEMILGEEIEGISTLDHIMGDDEKCS